MSLVEVLPVEPVTATTRASLRRRTSAAISPSASSGSSTAIRRGPACSRATSAATAPLASAWSTYSEPSVRVPWSATNRSPASTRRESVLTPRTTASSPVSAPVSAAISPVESGIIAWPAPRARPGRPRGRRTAGCWSANCWPCSCPLPAITTTSPGWAPSTARAMAAARSSSVSIAHPSADLPDDRRRDPRCAGCRWSRSASRPAPATAPIIGRLPRSRSPPHPNTQINRPPVMSRAARSTLSSESGVWA